MSSLAALSGITALFLAYLVHEYRRHQHLIRRIPHRIHVNGSRGKSSVTRLIGAGLRAGGVATVTKVTGTFPRLILTDGSDVPVHRRAAASILEQLDIVACAVEHGAEALVIECMALDPQYQRITEHQMVHATITVMTNIRLDHTDVMGRTIEAIGRSMANTMPKGGTVLIADAEHETLLHRLAIEQGAHAESIDGDGLAREDMAGFRYIEHRSNVALALAVCERLGVDREQALRGMWEAEPDAGVLTRSPVHHRGRTTTFFNAFAANDRDSTRLIWRMLGDDGHLRGERVVLLNSRADRKDRSEQLAHLVATELRPDRVLVMGAPTDAVVRLVSGHGYDASRIVDLGPADAESIYQAILAQGEREQSVVGIGNMGGSGAATAALFEQRSRERDG